MTLVNLLMDGVAFFDLVYETLILCPHRAGQVASSMGGRTIVELVLKMLERI